MKSFWDVARAVTWRNLRSALARPALMLPPLIIPLVFFATFAGGLSALGRAPGFDFPSGYTTFQFVFIWIQASAFNGMFSGFLASRDFENGFARRLMLAAPARLGIVAGYIGSTTVRATVGAVVLFGVAIAAGVRVDGPLWHLLLLVVLGLLVTVITSLWSIGVALRFRSIQAAPLAQIPIFLSMFMAPVFVPLALLSGWIHTVARGNPITVFLEEGRALIGGTDPQILLAFGVSAAAFVVMGLWGVRSLRSAERAG